jgi:SAM-dependent methyltransferase
VASEQPNATSVVSGDARHAAELDQGTRLATADADSVWGWSGAAGTIRADRRARFMIENCRLGPGVRCLELGAGTGIFTERLAATGCDLVAIELSPDTAARCQAKVGSAAEVVVGNIETGEGLEGRTFDAIVGVSVLHHIDLPAALASTFSLLAPGGRFAFSEPNIVNPLIWAERNIDWLRRRRHVLEHERAFTAGGLKEDFEEAGYTVDVAEPYEFLWPNAPGVLVPGVLRIEPLLERTPLRAIAGSVHIAGRRAA